MSPLPPDLPAVEVHGAGPVAGAAAALLRSLGVPHRARHGGEPGGGEPGGARLAWSDDGGPEAALDVRPAGAAWAASGAMALTGLADGPPELVAAQLVDGLRAAGTVLALVTGRLGTPVVVDALALLGERAAIAGFGRRGTDSVGGSAHLLPAADGWLALNLGRPDDLALLPAWLERDVDPADWGSVVAAIAGRPVDELVEQAALLGLPVGAVPRPGLPDEQLVARGQAARVTVPVLLAPGGPRVRSGDRPLVVDLSSLWAGPLCTRLLAAAGARVVKVEGARRPDGARRGPPEFFDLLHCGKEAVLVDFDDPRDVRFLRALVDRADVVVEGSRPRVLDGLGFAPRVAAAAGAVWVAITGYGRTGPWANRVAFGDDAAVAGGLVQPGTPPRFTADAVADPVAGLYAAVATATALLAGRGAVVDVALREAAAASVGDGAPVAGVVVPDGAGGHVVRGPGWEEQVRPPRAPRPVGAAPAAGAHDAAVRRELGRPSVAGPP